MRTRIWNGLLYLLIGICCGEPAAFGEPRKNQSEKGETVTMSTRQYPASEAGKLAESLRRKGISDERVLTAIAKVPRHLFIDERLAAYAYLDRPLPIEKGQTISQPYTVAFQKALLQFKPGDNVLEI